MRALLLATLLLLPAPAGADRIERGVVVGIEANNIYVDVPAARGAAAGRPLRLKRRLQLRHPATGRPVIDELPVGDGTLKVIDAGVTLSRAEVPAEMIKLIRVGDIAEVLVASAAAPPAPAPPSPPPAAPPEPDLDEHTAEVLRVWRSVAGHPLARRIATWDRFLVDHPDSPHAAELKAELAALRAAQAALRPPAQAADELRENRIDGLEHASPPAAPAGQDLQLAFLVRGDIQAAWLHYRAAGGESFRKLALRRDGDAYLRGRIPAADLQAPGVAYFVEAVDPRDRGGAAIASAADPIDVLVEPPPATRVFAERHRRSRITTSATFLDYATFDDRTGDHTDRFFLVETDFLYRLHAGWLHGVRSGFGVLQGEGGYIAAPAPGDQPQRAGFTYGYVEIELRPPALPAALLARAVTGLGDEGLGFGGEARLRLGDEQATSVTFGASSLEDIGFLSEIRMQFAAVERIPIGLGVALTDQPNRGDLGVRMSIDAGWRAVSWVAPMLRISYQGRSVRHSGLGGGLSLVFDW